MGGDKELQDRGLECSIDKRIFIDPMKTPCCEKTFCNECITNALIESDFTCPGCQTEGVLIDDLKPDTETSAKIKVYLEEKNSAAKVEKQRSKSPSVKLEAEPEVKTKSKSPSPMPATKDKSKSPPTTTSTPSLNPAPVKSENPKKRPDDEWYEWFPQYALHATKFLQRHAKHDERRLWYGHAEPHDDEPNDEHERYERHEWLRCISQHVRWWLSQHGKQHGQHG